MTAHMVGFVTRDQAGLRKPKSFSSNITPSKGGVALHYGGPEQRIRSHADCLDTWRGWQAFHMDDRSWADIAYTFGVCDHGYLLAGRGTGVRTAANGTDAGNQNFYAICWIGGEGQTPTKPALEAIEYGVDLLRKAGAGTAVQPHQFFKGTACPGGTLVATAAHLHDKPIVSNLLPSKESAMYSLIRIDGGNAVYAVRPGVWEHVKDLESLVAGGVTGREVRDLTAAQADILKEFVLRASPR